MAALLLSALLPLAAAVPCVQFDASFNLYAFGGENDVSLGAASSWSSPSPTTLSTTNRPPWTGNQTQCFLSQSNNAMYVYGGDASDLSSIYIYDFAANSWTVQATSGAPATLGNSRSSAVLDHDTNVIYTIIGAGQSMYQLDLGSVTNTASGTAAWSLVESPSFTTTNYDVTAALAANHIMYFGVPDTAAGSANVFVIHYAYFQPEVQAFPTTGSGSAFPDTVGQAVSLPTSENSTPYQMLFVPEDFSGAYLVSHWTDLGNYSITSDSPMDLSLINSTQAFPTPSSKDTNAAYACSDSACVQVDSTGDIYYITDAVSNYTVSSSATWSKMSYALTLSSSSSATGAASGTDAASGTATATGSGSAKAGSSTTKSSTSASGSSTAAASAAGRLGIRTDILGFTVGVAALVAATLL